MVGGVAVLVVILVIGVNYLSKIQNKVSVTAPPQHLVGNDRDVHGCIGSAGYSWCEMKQRCLRIEEQCTTSTSTLTEYKFGSSSAELDPKSLQILSIKPPIKKDNTHLYIGDIAVHLPVGTDVASIKYLYLGRIAVYFFSDKSRFYHVAGEAFNQLVINEEIDGPTAKLIGGSILEDKNGIYDLDFYSDYEVKKITPMTLNVDRSTFQYVGKSYFKDKNSVYFYDFYGNLTPVMGGNPSLCDAKQIQKCQK